MGMNILPSKKYSIMALEPDGKWCLAHSKHLQQVSAAVIVVIVVKYYLLYPYWYVGCFSFFTTKCNAAVNSLAAYMFVNSSISNG